MLISISAVVKGCVCVVGRAVDDVVVGEGVGPDSDGAHAVEEEPGPAVVSGLAVVGERPEYAGVGLDAGPQGFVPVGTVGAGVSVRGLHLVQHLERPELFFSPLLDTTSITVE